MSIIRVGSTSSYAEGWEAIFGGGGAAGKKPRANAGAKKAAKKKVAAKKTAKKKAAKARR